MLGRNVRNKVISGVAVLLCFAGASRADVDVDVEATNILTGLGNAEFVDGTGRDYFGGRDRKSAGQLQ